MKKVKKVKFGLVRLISFWVIALIIAQLVIAHRLATKGEELRQLESQCQRLELANSGLMTEVSKIGSLSRINQEAQELGLVKVSQVMHFSPQVPVALNNSDSSLDYSK
jgi:cell division protein FtsL